MSELQMKLLELAKYLKEGETLTVDNEEEKQTFDGLINEGYVEAKKINGFGGEQTEYVNVKGAF